MEFNLSNSTPVIAFMLLKSTQSLCGQLREAIENLPNANFAKKLEKAEKFVESSEFKNFTSIVVKETGLIGNCLEAFK